MAKQKVAFAVACNKYQTPAWWRVFATAVGEAVADPGIEFLGIVQNNTAQPDYTKDGIVGELFNERRQTLTDASRNDIMSQVDHTDAEWIYWWDDDTIHPAGTLRRLLNLNTPFASGVYHIKQKPYIPIVYFRNPNGTYRSMLNYERGELVFADFTGMGCALIHRSVYEKIKEAHSVFKTDRGNYVVLPKEDAEYPALKLSAGQVPARGRVYGDLFVQHVRPVSQEELTGDRVHWPFYGMEVTRTEDIWFCELAEKVGIKPLVDTDICCGHIGEHTIGRQNFRMYQFTPKEEAPDEA